jgi:hypothetical protein
MIGLRDKTWRRFGASLTGLALGLQLMLSSLGLVIAASVDPAEALAGHALCVAGGAPSPADAPSVPAHNHGGLCCLWHQISGIQPATTATPIPVTFAYIAPIPEIVASFSPGPQRGPVNARAPPILT